MFRIFLPQEKWMLQQKITQEEQGLNHSWESFFWESKCLTHSFLREATSQSFSIPECFAFLPPSSLTHRDSMLLDSTAPAEQGAKHIPFIVTHYASGRQNLLLSSLGQLLRALCIAAILYPDRLREPAEHDNMCE